MIPEKKVGNSVIRVVRGDITDMKVESFVYDIMDDAKLGSGYGSAITVRAGKSVQTELDAIGRCLKGEAIITSAGNMNVKHIIHVNGPKFHEEDQEGKLRRVVKSALNLAEKNNLAQIAFPPIGTGFYQVDLNLSARVIVETVSEHLKGNSGIKEVLLVALDTREFKPFETWVGKGG